MKKFVFCCILLVCSSASAIEYHYLNVDLNLDKYYIGMRTDFEEALRVPVVDGVLPQVQVFRHDGEITDVVLDYAKGMRCSGETVNYKRYRSEQLQPSEEIKEDKQDLPAPIDFENDVEDDVFVLEDAPDEPQENNDEIIEQLHPPF